MPYNYKRQLRNIKKAFRRKGYFPKGWSGIHQILSCFMERRIPFQRDVMIETFHSIKFIPRATHDLLKRIGKTPQLNFNNRGPKKFSSRNFYQSYAWRKLRYQTLNKYGRKCMCCGFTGPDRRLHIDHIKSIRKFWHLRLDPDNVQVLCEDCNHGKGSYDQTDFRPSPASTRVRITRPATMYPADADYFM